MSLLILPHFIAKVGITIAIHFDKINGRTCVECVKNEVLLRNCLFFQQNLKGSQNEKINWIFLQQKTSFECSYFLCFFLSLANKCVDTSMLHSLFLTNTYTNLNCKKFPTSYSLFAACKQQKQHYYLASTITFYLPKLLLLKKYKKPVICKWRTFS